MAKKVNAPAFNPFKSLEERISSLANEQKTMALVIEGLRKKLVEFEDVVAELRREMTALQLRVRKKERQATEKDDGHQ